MNTCVLFECKTGPGPFQYDTRFILANLSDVDPSLLFGFESLRAPVSSPIQNLPPSGVYQLKGGTDGLFSRCPSFFFEVYDGAVFSSFHECSSCFSDYPKVAISTDALTDSVSITLCALVALLASVPLLLLNRTVPFKMSERP